MASPLDHLIEEGIITEVVGRLQSGKEAEVFVVRYAEREVAAKVYKDRSQRSFKNNSSYKEGRSVRNTRDQRAMDRRSRFGRDTEEEGWKSAEVDAMYRLHAEGVRVPTPLLFFEGVLLMDLVQSADGTTARRLIDTSLDAEQANAAYHDMLSQLVRMLACDLIHGDLSPYNTLWAAAGVTIIDFPQVVSAAQNSNSERFFMRDAENILGYFREVDPRLETRRGDAAEIWRAYMRRELTADFMPTGRLRPPPPQRPLPIAAPRSPTAPRFGGGARNGVPALGGHGNGAPQPRPRHDDVPPQQPRRNDSQRQPRRDDSQQQPRRDDSQQRARGNGAFAQGGNAQGAQQQRPRYNDSQQQPRRDDSQQRARGNGAFAQGGNAQGAQQQRPRYNDSQQQPRRDDSQQHARGNGAFPQGGAQQQRPRYNDSQQQPRRDDSQQQPRGDGAQRSYGAQPQPRANGAQPQPRGDRTQPQPRGDRTQPQPRGDRTQPQPRGDRTQPQPRGDRTQPQGYSNGSQQPSRPRPHDDRAARPQHAAGDNRAQRPARSDAQGSRPRHAGRSSSHGSSQGRRAMPEVIVRPRATASAAPRAVNGAATNGAATGDAARPPQADEREPKRRS